MTRALSGPSGHSPERQAWAERRQKLFGFVPDPTMPAYPFHPDSRHSMVARCVVDAAGQVQAGFVPCWIDAQARPVPLARDAADATVEYVRRISAEAGLKTGFQWQGDVVAVTPAEGTR